MTLVLNSFLCCSAHKNLSLRLGHPFSLDTPQGREITNGFCFTDRCSASSFLLYIDASIYLGYHLGLFCICDCYLCCFVAGGDGVAACFAVVAGFAIFVYLCGG